MTKKNKPEDGSILLKDVTTATGDYWSTFDSRHSVAHVNSCAPYRIPTKANILVFDGPSLLPNMEYQAVLQVTREILKAAEPNMEPGFYALIIERQSKNHSFSKSHLYPMAAYEMGWHYCRTWVWIRGKEDSYRKGYYAYHTISLFSKLDKNLFEGKPGIAQQDIIRAPYGLDVDNPMVGEMPVSFFEDLFRIFGADRVLLDPFSGSGNSALAAINLGWQSVSCELHRQRYEKLINKIATHYTESNNASRSTKKR